MHLLETEFFNFLLAKSVNSKGNLSWIFIGRTDAEAESPVLWPPDARNWLIGKEPWFWERLKVGGGGDDRGWDGWMASPTQWTWVWANSGRWRTGKPAEVQSKGLKSVRHNLVTEELQLVVQWLRLCLPMQGLWVRSPVREPRSHMPCDPKNQMIKQK